MNRIALVVLTVSGFASLPIMADTAVTTTKPAASTPANMRREQDEEDVLLDS